MMDVALSYDHHLIDGREAVQLPRARQGVRRGSRSHRDSCTSSGDCDTIDLPDAIIAAGNVGRVCADPPPSNSLQAITDGCEDQCGENYRVWGVFVSSSPPFVSFTQNADCAITLISILGDIFDRSTNRAGSVVK
jgi:hypothetical protein